MVCKRWMILGILVAWGGAAMAEDIGVIKQEVRIPVGETRRFEFGTVPQENTTVLLDIFSRLDSAGFGGSSYFMTLRLNGKIIQPAKSRTVGRLKNREFVSPVAVNLPYAWFGQDAWRVLYSPDFAGALKDTFYQGNPYQLVLDVTDLTNPAAENRLEITNRAGAGHKAICQTNAELVIKSLVIHTQAGASPTMISSQTDADVINRGTPGAGPASYRGQLLPGGGFALQVGQKRLDFSSAFSYPKAGFNRFVPAGQPDNTGQPQWNVTTRAEGKSFRALATGPDYTVQRTVTFTPRKVEVSDQITNLHADAKLGIMVKHRVNLKGEPSAAVRLAGNADPSLNKYWSAANPSVYVSLGNLGLGMICEDDVFRNQAWLCFDAEDQAAGLSDENLCLPAGGSYTLRWSVYPVASNDYFDFINLVRQDWGSNYTVEGAWTFFGPDTIIATPVETLRDQFNRLGIKRACYCGGWVDWKTDRKKIGFGTGVLDPYWASFRDRLRQASAKIHEAVPDCKVLVYYDTQRDTSDGGHERFRDSWLTDPSGNQSSTEWSGVYSLTYSVVATLQDTYGKAMLQAVDQYMDEMKIDGLYWDEMEGVGYGSPLVTYNMPDGYSCEINPKDYTLTREIGITTILGEGHRLAVIDRVRAKGGTLMGNGPTGTRRLLDRHVQRMVEIQHNDSWAYEGNLDSCLGYASSRMDFGNWIRSLRMATLLVGTTYQYSHEISRYVFPFTPLELHSGYLLGRERIIATHGGNYGWPGERCLVQVHHFDEKGMLTPQDFPTTIESEARTAVTLKDGEAIILERLPVQVASHGGKLEAREVRYGADGLKMILAAPAGAKVYVPSGLLPLKAGSQVNVRIDSKTRPLTVAPDGSLTFEVKGLAVVIEVKP
jgi:hypothetical protein